MMATQKSTSAHSFLVPFTPSPYAIVHPWLVTSTASLLTTAYLLRNGYNYPMHLLWLHLSSALVLQLLQLLANILRTGPSATIVAFKQQAKQIRSNRPLLAALNGIVQSILTSGALIAGYQALLHFDTLPALAVAFMCFVQPWLSDPLIDSIKMNNLGCAGVFIFSMFSIYTIDARLNPRGAGCALVAAGFVLVAKVHDYFATTRLTPENAKPHETPKSAIFLIALAAATWGCWKWEYRIYSPLTWEDSKWLIIASTCTSALAMEIGASSQLFLWSRSNTPVLEKPQTSAEILLLSTYSTLLVASAASCFFAKMWPMNKWQYVGCFFMIEACLSMLHQNRVTLSDSPSWWRPESYRVFGYEEIESLADEEVNTERNEVIRTTLNNVRALFTDTTWKSVILRAVVMFLIWLGLCFISGELAPNKTHSTPIRHPPVNDIEMSFDFVAARYHEPISHLAGQINQLIDIPAIGSRRPRVVIYDKSNNNSTAEYAQELQGLMVKGGIREIVVESRANIGREAETYLHHILSRWDDLATHTLFMQAEMHILPLAKERIKQYLVPETAYLSLAHYETCSSAKSCSDHSTWSEESEILSRLCRGTHESKECEDGLLLSYRGQFIASASQIRAQERSHYADILCELDDPLSYAHSAAYADHPWMPGHVDSMTAPRFGYTMERMWAPILQCSETRIARACPSLWAGFLQRFVPWNTVRVEDCQCLSDGLELSSSGVSASTLEAGQNWTTSEARGADTSLRATTSSQKRQKRL